MTEIQTETETGDLTYEVVMATYNRPDAVALSLPLLLGQTRLPERITVVDASTDPAPIEALVAAAQARGIRPVAYVRASPGLTHQRNVGLRQCSADVVVFPDDDSLLYPTCGAELMAVYEADPQGRIAGVSAVSRTAPPPESGLDLGRFAAEKMTPTRARLRWLRRRLKDRMEALNPFVAMGRRLAAQHDLPAMFDTDTIKPVPYMIGFQMTYRRRALQPDHFDETLQRYGWYEDIDASFTALRHGALVGAHRAGIYHHRAAAQRANGRAMGLWAILNRGYIVMKHLHANPQVFPDRAREIARLKRYCRARALAYRAMARDPFARARAAGAAEGMTLLDALIASPPETLSETYKGLERDRAG